MSNLICGITAILLAIDKYFLFACLFIVIGSIFDVLDGKVASKIDNTSQFGSILDSLADLVTFGVAPMIILHLHYSSLVITVVAISLPVCGAWRLARYSSSTTKNRDFFKGLPITANAFITTGIVLLGFPAILAVIIIITTAILFVSKIKIKRLI